MERKFQTDKFQMGQTPKRRIPEKNLFVDRLTNFERIYFKLFIILRKYNVSKNIKLKFFLYKRVNIFFWL